MINHVILWNLEENGQAPGPRLAKIKHDLEALNGKIPGMMSLNVVIEPLYEQNADILLIATFEDKEAFENYRTNPEHEKVAQYVRGEVAERLSMDYES